MAKVFRTETLSLSDNIRLASSGTGAFEIQNAGGSTLMSKATIESDISSLHAQRVVDEGTTDSDVSSLAAAIASNDVVAISSAVTNGSDNSGSISFGRTFAGTPVVIALMRSTNANDPIISCMVSAVSTSAATVTFADSVPSANYTVELIASIG